MMAGRRFKRKKWNRMAIFSDELATQLWFMYNDSAKNKLVTSIIKCQVKVYSIFDLEQLMSKNHFSRVAFCIITFLKFTKFVGIYIYL